MSKNSPSTRTVVIAACRWLAASVMAVGAFVSPAGAGLASAAPASSCSDVEVVFARGTFEAPGVGDVGQQFVDALQSRLGGQTVSVYGVNYPASLDFQAAAQGIADATAHIQSVAATCPDTKIVLGGYSQGAAVMGYSTADAVPAGFSLPSGISGPMPAGVADHVAAVALFGTPDEGVVNLVGGGAPPITIGNLYVAKTIELCATGDPVCFPGGLDRGAHSAYKVNGMPDQAAAFAANRIVSAGVSA